MRRLAHFPPGLKLRADHKPSPEEDLVLTALRIGAGRRGYLPYIHALAVTTDVLLRSRRKTIERAEAELLLKGLTNEPDDGIESERRNDDEIEKPLDIVPLLTARGMVDVVAFHAGPAGDALDEESVADVDRTLAMLRTALLNAPPYNRLFTLGVIAQTCAGVLQDPLLRTVLGVDEPER